VDCSTCTEPPCTFVVAALVLLLLTPFVLLRAPTDVLPTIRIPVVSVVWLYNGLSAKEMEDRIIYLHEQMISAQVFDIEHVESTPTTARVSSKSSFSPMPRLQTAWPR
jgi:multidrug efflux pump subunit AcrB